MIGPEATQPTGVGLYLRAAIGGVLMGLANLVPGISGGTMLLAVGVYPAFIAAMGDVTLLRRRLDPWLLVGCIGGAAALAILLLAGTIRTLVIEHRWAAYSLFIGLTLGGVPIVWKLTRERTTAVWGGAVAGFALMVLMALGLGGAATTGPNYLLLFLSGLAGASAMILPGISGGYLLLLLGQYETILGAVDQVKTGLTGDRALLVQSLHVVIPVGLGVVAGIVGVSNLLKWLLRRYEKATLGVLLGLLVGAVVGLWPFQQGVEPRPGDIVAGQAITAEAVAAMDPEDWPVETFRPTAGQVGASLLLIGLGFVATQAIGRLGRTPVPDVGAG